MKKRKVEWAFVIWLKEFCDIDTTNDCFKWKVMVETHVYKLMSTKKAYKFWKKHIKK